MSQDQRNTNVYIALGSNIGDRAGNLLQAVGGMLGAGLEIVQLSSIYETQPVGNLDQPAFLNMIAELRTTKLPPEEVLSLLMRIESALGRTREVTLGPRTIDLDLLLYGDEQRHTQSLTLPHPRMHLRRFVLVPLAEIAPRLVHPTLHRTVGDLLFEVADQSEVRRWPR
jgi:2-amino-4-hydroxy-6-hydroxymethyldihydropteridine diphosphokinase